MAMMDLCLGGMNNLIIQIAGRLCDVLQWRKEHAKFS